MKNTKKAASAIILCSQMVPLKPEKNQVYHINFEEYLQPKKPFKSRKLLCNDELINKHNVQINNIKIKKKWRRFNEKLRGSLQTIRKIQNFERKSEKIKPKELRLFKSSRLQKISIKLPNCLAFLRARNDDGLCKRKSGFEIYCEMASIHGFYNFVGATTWQRALWFSVVFLAILFSTIVLIMLYLINIEMPFIISTESTIHAAWSITFPAITLCTQNHISELKARNLAFLFSQNSNVTIMNIMQLFRLVVYVNEEVQINPAELETLDYLLKLNNITLTQLSENLSPNCQSELVRCLWRGRMDKCDKIFRVVRTPFGLCCSFNLLFQNNKRPQHTTSAGYKAGLTVLISNNSSDYMGGTVKTSGYHMLIHDATDFPGIGGEMYFVPTETDTLVRITPQQTYNTDYVSGKSLQERRCYLGKEQTLETFASYSFGNCLAECHRKILFKLCNCVLLHMPMKSSKWNPCNATQTACLLKNSAVFGELESGYQKDTLPYRTNRYAEDFICKCYPLCTFNQYLSVLEMGVLDRTYSTEFNRFLKADSFKNQILLHVYYGDLVAHKLRMDVFGNWLSFIGTFGGITGLFMGCSFVSVCEMIFFVFVRPACNWLTKQQIRYHINRRAKKTAAVNAVRLTAQENSK